MKIEEPDADMKASARIRAIGLLIRKHRKQFERMYKNQIKKLFENHKKMKE